MNEVTTPEVLGSDLSPALSGHVNRAVAHHRKADAALRDWAENVVLCGLELIKAKEAVGHKEWLMFVEVSLPEISIRHVQRYMQVAAAFDAKMGRKLDPANMSDAQKAKFRKELAKQTAAVSWRQLMQDMGIGSGERTGRGGATPPAPRIEGKNAAKAAAAADTLARLVSDLRELTQSGAHKLIDPSIRATYAAALQDVCKELAR